MFQGIKTKKIKTTMTVNGQEREVEIEVPDIQASWGTKADRKHVGSSHTRVDARAKVTGKAKYTYDINLPGMLTGKILRCPHGKAAVKSIDLGPAEKMAGVRAVVALAKAGDVALYAGQEIAALAADTPEIAEDAIRAIKVEYDKQPHAVQEPVALAADGPKVFPGGQRGNVQAGRVNKRGEVAPALQSAAATIEGTYRAQFRVHACLETHGHVVAFQDDNKALKVWASTQAVHGTADDFARITQLPRGQIEVICEHMGGGFGSKFGPGVEGTVAAQLARQTGKPIKLMLDRREEVESAGNGPSGEFTVKMAADKDGAITAVQAKGYSSGGIGFGGLEVPYGIYGYGAVEAQQDTVFLNLGPSNSFRAPGRPQSSFITESALDELAYKLGMDPLEMRLKNDRSALRREEFRLGAEAIGWKEKFNKAPGKGGRFVRGVGCAGGTWGGRGGAPNMKAEVRIGADGSVTVSCGTQDLGTGVRSFLPLIVADELGLEPGQIKPEIGNSKLPLSGGSGGSTTTPTVAPSVKMAAIQAKFDFLSALAKATGEKLENLTLKPGGIVSNGSKDMTWADACKRLPAGGIVSQGAWTDTLIQGPVFGVQFADVEVDMDTGRVRVKKMVAVQDCGIVLNRLTATSQVNSGVIQGLAYALLEDRVADQQNGRVMNANLEEYKLPGSLDIPDIQVILYEPENVAGVSGMAEPAIIPAASAIANAVYNASGARVRTLPITPKRVLEALGRVPMPKGKTA